MGVALLGSVFLDRLGSGHSPATAAATTLIAATGLLVVMLATAFLLPRHVRDGRLSHP